MDGAQICAQNFWEILRCPKQIYCTCKPTKVALLQKAINHKNPHRMGQNVFSMLSKKNCVQNILHLELFLGLLQPFLNRASDPLPGTAGPHGRWQFHRRLLRHRGARARGSRAAAQRFVLGVLGVGAGQGR